VRQGCTTLIRRVLHWTTRGLQVLIIVLITLAIAGTLYQLVATQIDQRQLGSAPANLWSSRVLRKLQRLYKDRSVYVLTVLLLLPLSRDHGRGFLRSSNARFCKAPIPRCYRARNINNVASGMTFRFPVRRTELVACPPTSHYRGDPSEEPSQSKFIRQIRPSGNPMGTVLPEVN
jgi:hypothetical protein